MARKETVKAKVVKEHVIPLDCITKELVALGHEGKTSLEDISGLLDKMVVFATITKTEDQLLRNANLNSVMPDEYYAKGHSLYQDSFARYKIVGIELE